MVGVGALLVLLGLVTYSSRPDAAAGIAQEKTASTEDADRSRPIHARPLLPRFTASGAVASETADAARSPAVSREDCERTCGVSCVDGPDGRPQCPKVCTTDDQCDSGALCLPVRAGGAVKRCTVSDCAGPGGADDCGPGLSCRYTGRLEGGVYRCLPVGPGQVGEGCFGSSTAGLCAKGLRCVLGTCQPDSCGSDSDCQKGFRCRPVAGGDGHHKCFPGCSADEDCPSGELCVQAGVTSLCTKARDTCLKTGCPAGLVCHIESLSTVNLRTSCRRPCDPGQPGNACGPEAEQVCAGTDFWNQQRNVPGVCFQKCLPSDSNTCPKNYVCRMVQEGGGRCFLRPSGPAGAAETANPNAK
jgi:hypothetical protein